MIYFLIPAWNEEDTVGLLLYKVREVMKDVRREFLAVVLDDGSEDATGEMAEKYQKFLPVKVLRHAENRGMGPSLDRLVREATRLSKYPDRDIAITLEADFSFSPDAVPQMVQEIEAGADVVVGARNHPESEVDEAPFTRRSSSSVVSTVLRAVMPVPGVSDYLSTFRAYRIGTLKRALETYQESLITTSDAAANVELLLRLARFHPTFVEVPVHCRFDIRARPSRHRWSRSVKSHLSLTGRVDRVAAPAG
ncbi:MAG: glycosyltransferase family 2 protein [Gemmatimonadota bacterium]|nr:glycosyltransferase family 2 protein [Gemmatimonadota bacterium]